ncbi:hypothetical protein BG015_007962 [Linnemannia schmuckeri]|uniref:Uncharacterized protein n=1 Tax=Linnemannia schmuckeri TaxID=64567 RepID=A0A9P5S8A2_9FUNG|nr:hypothetical protein BG015_007962 [Linnemannia schmuckeri]
MVFSVTRRSFTLATAAVLAMVVLSASSTSAAPAAPAASVVDEALYNQDFFLGTFLGQEAPEPLVHGGLDGNQDKLDEKPYSPHPEYISADDKAVYNAGYLIGYYGTTVAPESFVDGGINGAKYGSGQA